MIEQHSQHYSDIPICGLFDRPDYPIFEGQECVQYIQEYLPFHLPQIEYALNNTLKNILINTDKMFVLDAGSGPATVPMVLCKLIDEEQCLIDFEITTIEASKTFNDMIHIFKEKNTVLSVEIIENQRCKFQEFTNQAEKWSGHFDWVIMANFVSALGKTIDEVYYLLNDVLAKLLTTDKRLLLTIIETGKPLPKHCIRQLNVWDFEDIEITETVFQIMDEQLDASWLKCCKYYETKFAKYRPNVNAKSVVVELKK